MSTTLEKTTKIFCKCCLKILTPDDSRIPVTEKTREIFIKFIKFTLKDGVICSKCNTNLLTFDAFQREVRRKHSLVAIVEKDDEIQEENDENKEKNNKSQERTLNKRIKVEDPLDIEDEEIKIVKKDKNTQKKVENKVKNKKNEEINEEQLIKEIKQEDPLDIKDETPKTSNQPASEPKLSFSTPRLQNGNPITHKSIPVDFRGDPIVPGDPKLAFKGVKILHKSFPVMARRMGRYDRRDLDNLRNSQRLAASLREQAKNRSSLIRVIPKPSRSLPYSPSLESIETFEQTSTASNDSTGSASNEEIFVSQPEAHSTDEHPESDDEVMILPPEPPIDLDSIDENQTKTPVIQGKMFKCDHCNAVSTKKEIIVSHIQKSHSFPCFYKCGKVYPSIEKLNQHVNRVHCEAQVGSNKRKQKLQQMDWDMTFS